MHKLMEYVCDELEELEKKADKGKLSMSEIEYADKLAHLKKNLLRSEELMEDGYSGDNYSRYDGGMSFARGRGSNANRDSRGRYSSDRGYSQRGYSRYSRDNYAMDDESVIQELRSLMNEVPEHKKQKFQRFISEMEQM